MAEKEILEQALITCKGNRQLAAKILGIGKTTIYDKLSRYQVTNGSFAE